MLTVFIIICVIVVILAWIVVGGLRRNAKLELQSSEMSKLHFAEMQEIEDKIDKADKAAMNYIYSRDEKVWPDEAVTHLHHLQRQAEDYRQERDRVERRQANERGAIV